MKRAACIIFVLLAYLLCHLCACSTEKEDAKKLKDLPFTIVKEEDIPQELKNLIEEKKHHVFKLTYEDEGKMYIAVGYGEQKTGGYSIQVKDLYLTKNAIYFDTEIYGPKKEDIDQETASYPYIVVKIEQREEFVVFQ